MNPRLIVLEMVLVVIVLAVSTLAYFGTGSGTASGQKFQVDDLQVFPGTSAGFVVFTLSNHSNLPIVSVSVGVSQVMALQQSPVVSSIYPISPGEGLALHYEVLEGVMAGQSYYITIAVQFGDGSVASYSATVLA